MIRHVNTPAFKTSLPAGWIVQERGKDYDDKEDIINSLSAIRKDVNGYRLTIMALPERAEAETELDWKTKEDSLEGSIVARGIVAKETFGYYSWFERAYELQAGGYRCQAMLCTMEFDKKVYLIILTTPYGFLTVEAATTLQQVMTDFSVCF